MLGFATHFYFLSFDVVSHIKPSSCAAGQQACKYAHVVVDNDGVVVIAAAAAADGSITGH